MLFRSYQLTWAAGIVSGLVAVLCFGISVIFKELESNHKVKFYLTCSEIICFFLSYIFLSHFANKYRSKFIMHRKKAEELRAKLWFHSAFISVGDSNLNVSSSIKSDHTSLQNEFQNTIRILWIYCVDQLKYQKEKRIKKFNKYLHQFHKLLSCLKIGRAHV